MILLVLACGGKGKGGKECGPGTHAEGDVCVPDDDTDADDTDPACDCADPLTDDDGDGWAAEVDCDDSTASVHPGAKETCGNGVDDDCLPATDCRWRGSVRPSFVFEDPSGITGRDFLVSDLTGDGVVDLVVSGDRQPKPRIWVLEGPISKGGGVQGSPFVTADVYLPGMDLASAELTGDGEPDLVVGGFDGVWVVPGPIAGGESLEDAAVIELSGTTVGWSVDAGDVTDDGNADLAIGAPQHDNQAGRVYLHTGPLSDTTASSGAVHLLGASFDELGRDVLLGADFDGDGVADVTAAGLDSTWVFTGPVTAGSVAVGDAENEVFVGVRFEANGIAAADVDQDGRDDLIASDLVAFGPLPAAVLAGAGDIVFADPTIDVGREVAAADFDGDGVIDLVVSTRGHPAALIYFGPVAPGTHVVDDADAFVPMPHDDYTLVAGDLGGDGFDDLVAGYGRVSFDVFVGASW